jgi:nitric oxide reductase activation protein
LIVAGESWDERLFGSLYRAVVSAWRGGGPLSSEELSRGALLATRTASLRVFASALRGAPMELLEAEQIGGVQGDTLRLPGCLSFAPTPEENERALLLRVAFGAISSRLGFVWGGAEAQRSLATLLAVPLTMATLADELPGATEAFGTLVPAVLAARPHLESLGARDEVLELFARGLLGLSLDQRDTPAVDPHGLIGSLLAARPTEPAGLAARVAEVDRLLPSDARTRSRARRSTSPAWPAVVLWGSLYSPETRATGEAFSATPGETGQAGARTERRGRPREGVRRALLEEAPADAENPVLHSFEKVHTAEAFQGGAKRADGDDELADHAEALEELELREVVRSTERAASLYRSDVVIENGGFDVADELEASGTESFPYDEWDERKRTYRHDFCTVYAGPAPEPSDRAEARRRAEAIRRLHRKSIVTLRNALEKTESDRRWRSRQTDGPEIDFDAMVERHAALRSGRAGTERLYAVRAPHQPEVAVLVLLDQSLSTDAWVGGRRVLDVAREAMLVLSAALRDVRLATAMASFSSNTRHDCRFATIKHFTDSWTVADRRLMAIEPVGYTRIGPALRHGAHLLDGWHARRKLLLLVSDGKPSDYDRYEGRYGVADVRQAIREAKPRGISTFALAIDGSARFCLPQMFGPSGYTLLRRPDAMANELGRVFREALR